MDLPGPSKSLALMVGCVSAPRGTKPWSPPQCDPHTPGLLTAQDRQLTQGQAPTELPFCGWLEEKFGKDNSDQSESPALRKKLEELKTVKPGVAGETARLGAVAAL